jgi:hypothetical protein
MTDPSDSYLNTSVNVSAARGPSAALVLRSVADTLDNAPEDVRFDLRLKVSEDE